MPELRFAAIGTSWSIETPDILDAALVTRVEGRIEEFDRTWSRFRSDSLVSTVAESGGSYDFPADAPQLFDLYDELFRATDGAVTPLVGRGLETLGYDREYSLTPTGPAAPADDWSAEVSRRGSRLITDAPVLIDVGAAGKGYLVDLVGELLTDAGVREFVIDASGDLLVSVASPRRIALEHPFDPSLAIGVVTMSRGSICASGSNRRVWGSGLHHILDGRTGEPTRDIVATWAIADAALVADGLATALFFADPAVLAETFEFEYVRLFASGRAESSPAFPGELFR
ncbi:MAG: FAD:protein transferase [Microbacteriaceae bacterium]|nr:FAD:protein transferase [Microbacteriaceae bacterium]